MQADTLFHMLELSGARFALMSPVYPESPGLLLFITQFLTVLSGLPEWLPQGLLVTIPLWCVGLFLLSRSAPLLAWFSGVQVLLLISWLVFFHTMSVDYGGGRVFYAYRWTRPLLLGIIVPFAGLALRPSLKWSAGAIAVVSLPTSAASIVDNLRPDVRAAVDHVSANAMSGDAWGVLPAGFYGDPVLYALHEGTPPSYITRMQTFDTKISDAHIRGPVMEGYQPFETAIDRLAYERIWTFEFAESMFGTPKFDPGVIRRTHAALQAEGWEQSDSQVFPFVHVSRYRCSVECEWMGARLLTFRLGDRLSSERYLALPAGRPFSPLPETAVTLVLPRETRSLTLKWSESTAGRAHLSDLDCMTSDSRMTCTLPPDRSKRVRTELQLSGGLTTEDIVVEVMR